MTPCLWTLRSVQPRRQTGPTNLEQPARRLRDEFSSRSGAAWPAGPYCGLPALKSPGGGLLALSHALIRGPIEPEQPATSSAGREQLREWLLSGWEPHPDVSWRWRHQEGPRHPRETRAGGSAATPSHMRTTPRRQLATRPARARHVAPGLGRWLIRLLELTIRLHARACIAQVPRAAPRTVAPHRPRALSAPRGRMRSNARECRYRSVEARGTAAQWLAPSG